MRWTWKNTKIAYMNIRNISLCDWIGCRGIKNNCLKCNSARICDGLHGVELAVIKWSETACPQGDFHMSDVTRLEPRRRYWLHVGQCRSIDQFGVHLLPAIEWLIDHDRCARIAKCPSAVARRSVAAMIPGLVNIKIRSAPLCYLLTCLKGLVAMNSKTTCTAMSQTVHCGSVLLAELGLAWET